MTDVVSWSSFLFAIVGAFWAGYERGAYIQARRDLEARVRRDRQEKEVDRG